MIRRILDVLGDIVHLIVALPFFIVLGFVAVFIYIAESVDYILYNKAKE
jgi:hypothetical protein